MLACINTFANDNTDDAIRIYYGGDRSQAMGLFYDIYNNDNNNAEALYQIAVANYENKQISKEEFNATLKKATELAFESKEDSLAHYILSQAASKTGNKDLALEEIDQALKIEPTSVRYLRGKMLFLASKAKQSKNKELFFEAMDYAKKGIEVVDSDPKKYFTKGSLHFEIARWVHGCCSKYRDIIIYHYKESIESNEMSQTKLSYAWNNMSYQLYKLGRCNEAKDAAENALKISTYGYALQNLESAKMCLAGNNVFYKIWYKIESWIRIILSFFY